jgi:hypothetical protein
VHREQGEAVAGRAPWTDREGLGELEPEAERWRAVAGKEVDDGWASTDAPKKRLTEARFSRRCCCTGLLQPQHDDGRKRRTCGEISHGAG